MVRQIGSRGLRLGYLIFGWLMVALGFIGALLPVMPTTVFLILAAWAFGRASPRFEGWLLSHPVFGPVLRDWRANGRVSRRVKYIACGGMAVGVVVFWGAVRPGLGLGLSLSAVMAALILWMALRPEP